MNSRPENVCQFLGRLTTDPKKRETSSETCCSFTLAVDRPPRRDPATKEIMKDTATGYPIRETDFPQITCWGNLADTILNSLVKGRKVLVQAEYRTSKTQQDDGTTKYFTDLRANNITFLDPKTGTGQSQGQNQQEQQPPEQEYDAGAPQDEF